MVAAAVCLQEIGFSSAWRWFQLDEFDTLEDLQEDIEVWFGKDSIVGVSDTEGLGPDSYGLSIKGSWNRYEDLKEVSDIDAYFAWMELQGAQYATPENFQDAYVGTFEDDTKFAWWYVETYGVFDMLPSGLQWLSQYFDAQKYSQMLLTTHFRESDGHYFQSC
tara:strand:- start:44 stop:532 length:489 start_codon:yes stop_codon:yes gene_type:complete